MKIIRRLNSLLCFLRLIRVAYNRLHYSNCVLINAVIADNLIECNTYFQFQGDNHYVCYRKQRNMQRKRKMCVRSMCV